MGMNSSVCDAFPGHACTDETYSPCDWSREGVRPDFQTIPDKAKDFTRAGQRHGPMRPNHGKPNRARLGKSEVGNHRKNLQGDCNASIRNHEGNGTVPILSVIYPYWVTLST